MVNAGEKSKANKVLDSSRDMPKEDRISQLPDRVIEYILDRVTIGDAVRTSILARRWRQVWTRIRVLVFDHTFVQREIEYRKGRNKKPVLMASDFIEAVGSVLLLHNGPIYRFVLVLQRVTDPLREPIYIMNGNVHKWMHVVSRSGVKQLTIDCAAFMYSDDFRPLSSYVFDCLELRHLVLRGCWVHIPSNFRGFENLISLEHDRGWIDGDGGLDTLISCCPLLGNLSVKDHFGTLSVSALNLRTLHLRTSNLSGLSLLNVPNLVTLHLMESSSGFTKKYDVISVFGSASKIASTTLDNGALLVMGKHHVPKMLPKQLECHTNLSLFHINMDNQIEMSVIFCILRSSPFLMTLRLYLHSSSCQTYEVTDTAGAAFLEEQLKEHNYYTSSLLTVTMEALRGTQTQIIFLKFILTACPALEMLYVNACSLISQDAEQRKMIELKESKRASVKAKINYSKSGSLFGAGYSGPADKSVEF